MARRRVNQRDLPVDPARPRQFDNVPAPEGVETIQYTSPRSGETYERWDRGDGRDQYGRLMPGHTGNPNGRPIKPKRKSLRKAIREHVDPDEFARNLIRDANMGDPAARRLIMNYLEGLPTQKVEMTHQMKQAPVTFLPSNGRELPVPQQVIEHDRAIDEAQADLAAEEADFEIDDSDDDDDEQNW